MNDDCIFQVYETNQSIEYDNEYNCLLNKLFITWNQTSYRDRLHINKRDILFDNFPIVLESIYSIKWIDWNFYE